MSMVEPTANGALGSAVVASQSSNTAYEARRSNRVDVDLPSDGDSWKEQLVVCEGNANKLVIRAFYKNTRTGQRVWDEPPTGASDIVYASAEKRQDAEGQLRDLQTAMESVSPTSSGASSSKGKKKTFFNAFRRKAKEDGSVETSSNNNDDSKRGFFGRKKKVSTTNNLPSEKKKSDEVIDVDLQHALALSMEVGSGYLNNTFTTPKKETNSEEMQIAQALSMSEAEALRMSEAESKLVGGISEDEMLQRALEASRLETTGVASLPSEEIQWMVAAASSDSDFPEQEVLKKPPSPTRSTAGAAEEEESDFLDQKMPAETKSPPKKEAVAISPVTSLDEFDPYSKEASVAAATGVAKMSVAALSSDDAAVVEGGSEAGLRKMETEEHWKPNRLFSRVISKKSMKDKAGVV